MPCPFPSSGYDRNPKTSHMYNNPWGKFTYVKGKLRMYLRFDMF